ncbi:glycoside hydrolase family 9 protein [Microbulbifer agarilyticus]
MANEQKESSPAEASTSIRMNQLGFPPTSSKLAVVLANKNPDGFVVRDMSSNEVVLRGVLQPSSEKTLGGLPAWHADFSSIQMPGQYALETSTGYRQQFTVADGIYETLASASLKAFYFQRASMPIEEKYAGIWARPAGHADDKILIHTSAASPERPADTLVTAPKGWYDAGDYNKYVVNSGITTGTLMSAYERYPEYFLLQSLNIPESGDDLPDVLNEVRYNLDWLAHMQDPHDGGVYHKLTSADFEGMLAPDKAIKTRYMVQKGTAATLDFAAVMAQAARVFAPFDPQQATGYLKAAESAWQWAEENPSLAYRQDQLNKQYDPDIVTGAYGDEHFADERFWAAAELFIATGKPQYWSLIHATPSEFTLPSWADVRWLGYYSLLLNKDKLPAESEAWHNRVTNHLLQAALDLHRAGSSSAYRVPIASDTRHYVWGSNAVAANQGILMLEAFRISGDPIFLHSAEDTLDYILGRNATGYSYVTGFGTRTPLHPHHRLAAARPDLPPLPGFIVGGPNPSQQDDCDYSSVVADASYTDHVCSYASNEIAINWNAPFAYLVNALQAEENRSTDRPQIHQHTD